MARSLCSLLLVILHLCVDGPDVVFGGNSVDDIFYGGHGGQHGVVLVVIFVHAVAAHEEKILEAVKVTADNIEAASPQISAS